MFQSLNKYAKYYAAADGKHGRGHYDKLTSLSLRPDRLVQIIIIVELAVLIKVLSYIQINIVMLIVLRFFSFFNCPFFFE